jgi:hypothetical protein
VVLRKKTAFYNDSKKMILKTKYSIFLQKKKIKKTQIAENQQKNHLH